MDEAINKLKNKITELAGNDSFIHHKWFIKYHQLIVEKISDELCDIYKDADRNIVMSLLWVHDIGKIMSITDQQAIEKIESLMLESGHEADFVAKVIEYYNLMEKKMEIDLNESPIEVRIVSSADGASHFIGPFMSIYIQENYQKDIDDLMLSNINKANKDWNRKIVLPEVKTALRDRYKFILENNGQFPDKFIF